MRPDVKNTWMENQIGTFEPASSAETASGPSSTKKVLAVGYAVVRTAVGLLFAWQAAERLFGLYGAHPLQHNPGMLAAGILELVGGVLIALGLFTHPVGLLLCAEVAVAYFRLSIPGGFWPALDHGELALAFCLVFLCAAIFGGGKISLDAMRGKKRAF